MRRQGRGGGESKRAPSLAVPPGGNRRAAPAYPGLRPFGAGNAPQECFPGAPTTSTGRARSALPRARAPLVSERDNRRLWVVSSTLYACSASRFSGHAL